MSVTTRQLTMKKDPASHHGQDKLFKSAFQDSETLADFVRNFFPAEIADSLDLGSLALDDTHYISGKMVETFADVVYRTTWKKGGRSVAVVLLLEHKSRPERYFQVQALSYVVSIWQKDIKAKRPLSIVLPAFFYGGKKVWRPKNMLAEFKDLPPELEPFIPAFEFIFFKVEETPDEIILRLSADTTLGALMLMFKKVGDLEFIRAFMPLFFKFEENHPDRKQLFDIFVAYFFHNAPLPPDQIRELADQSLDENMRAKVMTAFDKLLLEKQQKGEAIGEARGEAKKQIEMIERLLMQNILTAAHIADAAGVAPSKVEEVKKTLIQDGRLKI